MGYGINKVAACAIKLIDKNDRIKQRELNKERETYKRLKHLQGVAVPVMIIDKVFSGGNMEGFATQLLEPLPIGFGLWEKQWLTCI